MLENTKPAPDTTKPNTETKCSPAGLTGVDR